MRIGSLFAGIGGLELGLEWAGLGPVIWQVESDKFCRRVLAQHWPDAERFDNVQTVGATTLSPVELICGGFPCQDISRAGKGAGLAGKRSGLWREFARVVDEIKPAWVVVENVAGGARLWVDAVVSELVRLGYHTIPIPLSAADVGAPHMRRRIFVVAHSDSGQLRVQPRRGGGANREDAALATRPRKARTVAHSDCRGQHARPIDAEVADSPESAPHPTRLGAEPRPEPESGRGQAWRHAEGGGWWVPESPVFGVAHGIPNRVDRLRALGNAVVPQCAEVIGWVIRELSPPQQPGPR